MGVREVGVRNTWSLKEYTGGGYMLGVFVNAPRRVRPTLEIRILKLFKDCGQARFAGQQF